jgi:glucose-1-phosphate adenylyltransferase
MKTIGLISANYRGDSFGELTENRTLASLPYGGRYRLIDFALSNMANSGITTVGIIAPYDSGSLIDHIGIGNPWSLGRKSGGLFVMPGSLYGVQAFGSRFLIRDMVKNIKFFERDDADYVIISSSSDVYNMDYQPLIEAHSKSGKPLTMVYKKMPRGEDLHNMGFCIDIDETGRVTSLNEKAYGWCNYFMDCCIANREFMIDFLNWFGALEYMDMFDVVKDNLDTIDVGAFEFRGYFGKITSPRDFLVANQGMTDYDIRNEVFCNPERLILTKAQDEAPVFHASESDVRNSTISAGCKIDGKVENSTIFRSVNIEKNASVRNSVIMMHCNIGEGAVLDNVICDKYVTINPGVKIYGTGSEPIIIGKGQTI